MTGIIYRIDEESGKSVIDELRETKQDKLISGVNIKTINGESLLGPGDLAIKDCVQSFTSMRDFPEEGSSAIIYIARDTDKQYAWDEGEYAELSREDEIERVYVNNSTLVAGTLTPEQIEKAHNGKIILYEGMGVNFYPSGKNTFMSDLSMSTASYYGRNLLPSGTTVGRMNAYLSDATGEIRLNNDLSQDLVPLKQENFFGSAVAPVSEGKRIVREMNIAGKLVPPYTSADANKHIAVNQSGDGLAFVEEEFATELEVRRLFRTEYGVTSSVTNGTFSGDDEVWTGETATITFVPNDGYALPEDVTVTNSGYSYDDSTGEVVLSDPTGEVTVSCVCVKVPAKGDLVTLGAKTFRVLNVDGRECDLMCYEDTQVSYGPTNTAPFETADGQRSGDSYLGSGLDTYCNETWFSALPQDVQDAVIQQSVEQEMYETFFGEESESTVFSSSIFSDGVSGYRVNKISTQPYRVGKRNARSLDVNDLINYLGKTAKTTEMYDFISPRIAGREVALASVTKNYGGRNCYVNYYYVTASSEVTFNYSRYVRPIIRIDISKAQWTETVR